MSLDSLFPAAPKVGANTIRYGHRATFRRNIRHGAIRMLQTLDKIRLFNKKGRILSDAPEVLRGG